MASAIGFILLFFMYGCRGLELVYLNTTETEMNVTACSSNLQMKLGYFLENLTWYQAQNACLHYGYDYLDYSLPHRTRRSYVKDLLNSINKTTATIWTDYQRFNASYTTFCPYSRKNKRHVESTDLLRSPADQELCLAIVYNMSKPIDEAVEFEAENCFAKHQYVCYSKVGSGRFGIYDNYDVLDVPEHLKTVETTNIESIDECIEVCMNKTRCSLVSYNNSTLNCTAYHVNGGYGVAEVTIRRKEDLSVSFANIELDLLGLKDSVTVGVNIGCSLEINRTITPKFKHSYYMDYMKWYHDWYEFNLTKCPTPEPDIVDTGNKTNSTCEAFCVCHNTTISEKEFEVMVAKLRVPKDKTSSHWRKTHSAEDNRVEAKTIGTIGLVITIVISLLPVLSDVVTFLKYKQSRRKKVNIT